MSAIRINPLSRRPQARRLVVAIRGAAGSGKSHFAASMVDADVGRLCFFDTERKARLLPGSDGRVFDAIEIRHPDELPAFIDWALDGAGQAQNYGAYVLDSWAMYFGRKHRATVQAVRERTGDPLAQPTADMLANDQVVFQEVLRRLCIDSGACVVITDQIAAKGREEREENEMGRILPMTASGLEYFVDVMLELEVRMVGFEQVRIARVVKTNAPEFRIGEEIEAPTFHKLLDRLTAEPMPTSVVPEDLPEPAQIETPVAVVSLNDLLGLAERFNISQADLRLAARHYCQTNQLERLNEAQLLELMARMRQRYEPETPADVEPSRSVDKQPEDATPITSSTRQKKRKIPANGKAA